MSGQKRSSPFFSDAEQARWRNFRVPYNTCECCGAVGVEVEDWDGNLRWPDGRYPVSFAGVEVLLMPLDWFPYELNCKRCHKDAKP